MEQHKFNIPNISCGHCTAAIESELREIKGIAGVQSNVSEKSITVQWKPPVTKEKIIDILREINYPAA